MRSLADAQPPIALGPLDGRYRAAVAPLVDHLSEPALNRARVLVEIEWLIHLTDHAAVPGVRRLTDDEQARLRAIVADFDSADIAERARANPAFFTSVAVATGGALALSAGGVLIRAADGAILGAIGVSGDTPDIDAACARAGVAAFHGDR